MDSGTFLMTQKDRDRLVALKKAKKGLITQRQAAQEIGQSERHVRRLLKRLKGKGDRALVHALRGRPSNRKLDEKTKQKALEILGREVYHAATCAFSDRAGFALQPRMDPLIKAARFIWKESQPVSLPLEYTRVQDH